MLTTTAKYLSRTLALAAMAVVKVFDGPSLIHGNVKYLLPPCHCWLSASQGQDLRCGITGARGQRPYSTSMGYGCWYWIGFEPRKGLMSHRVGDSRTGADTGIGIDTDTDTDFDVHLYKHPDEVFQKPGRQRYIRLSIDSMSICLTDNAPYEPITYPALI